MPGAAGGGEGEKANQLASLWLAGARRGLRTALAEPGQFPPCISVVSPTTGLTWQKPDPKPPLRGLAHLHVPGE